MSGVITERADGEDSKDRRNLTVSERDSGAEELLNILEGFLSEDSTEVSITKIQKHDKGKTTTKVVYSHTSEENKKIAEVDQTHEDLAGLMESRKTAIVRRDQIGSAMIFRNWPWKNKAFVTADADTNTAKRDVEKLFKNAGALLKPPTR